MNISSEDGDRANFAIQSGNLPLFQRRPEVWMFALMVDRLEEPLRTLRMEALESQDLGDARALLSFAGCTTAEDEHASLADSAGWLLERTKEMQACAQELVSCANAGLQRALGPPGEESDPVGLERFCTGIVEGLTRLLDLEKRILGRRLHPNVQELQLQFAGVSADVIASHQEFVARMRHFLENEDGNNFEFTIHVNFDRLLSDASDPVVTLRAKPTKTGAKVAGGCTIMAALVIVGMMLPFPILLVLVLLVLGVWWLQKPS